jgi:hypothetical protein
VAERQDVLKLFMISHSLCRNILGTIQEKCEFPFASFPMHYSVVLSSVISKDALTSGDLQIAASMQIGLGMNTELSEVISDVGIIRIPTTFTHS